VTRLRQCRVWLWPPATILETLDELRRAGIRLGLVSNCSPETVTLWPGQPLAPRLDAVGFSCVIGAAKPDPTIFLKVCSDLGVAPATCMFVGDGGSDELTAATALGMRAIRTRQFADNDPGWTGEEITDLRQLPRLLGL
jgi:putative hydrolase of the HAD superfamily